MSNDLFPAATPADVSLADQVACVEREIKMRERVYPRWVQSERMTQAQAARELLAMRAVLESLRALYDGYERPDPLDEALNSGDGSYRP